MKEGRRQRDTKAEKRQRHRRMKKEDGRR